MSNSDSRTRAGVLGASSLVGTCLLQLLAGARWQVTAYSRRTVERIDDGVKWIRLASTSQAPTTPPQTLQRGGQIHAVQSQATWPAFEADIPFWICVAPIWVLPQYFELLAAHGVRRVVALSSTSRFTKEGSIDPKEQAVAVLIADAEASLQKWAKSRGVEWVILRPTLIYGLGRDKNISEIARFIRRFGFFPLFGNAKGLRQPVHAVDVAQACLAASGAACAANRAYNISGRESLAYRDMVARVFSAIGRRPRLLIVPLWVFRLGVGVLRFFLPRYRHWSVAMAERMNRDLVFDCADAQRDLDFQPRAFMLGRDDLPT